MQLHNLCRWYQNGTSHPYRWYQNATTQYMSIVSKCCFTIYCRWYQNATSQFMSIVSKCYFSIHDDGIKMLPPIPIEGIKMLLHNLCRWYQNATSHPYRWYQNATSQFMSMVSKCYFTIYVDSIKMLLLNT